MYVSLLPTFKENRAEQINNCCYSHKATDLELAVYQYLSIEDLKSRKAELMMANTLNPKGFSKVVELLETAEADLNRLLKKLKMTKGELISFIYETR